MAFDIDYNKVASMLQKKRRDMDEYAWNITPVFSKVIEDLGGQDMLLTEEITVGEFCEEYPNGTYIIKCKNPSHKKKITHLVCIIDGDIYDTFDPSKYNVQWVWKIKEDKEDIQGKEIDSKAIINFIDTEVKKRIIDLANNIFNDESHTVDIKLYETFGSAYTYKFYYDLQTNTNMLGLTDTSNPNDGTYVLKITPRMNMDKAKEVIMKAADIQTTKYFKDFGSYIIKIRGW